MSTSGLTVDETILLDSIGWEPRQLVCGSAAYSIPKGFWSIGRGESEPATLAYERAVGHAVDAIAEECRRFGGHGVAGVLPEIELREHYVQVTIVGTAIGPGTKDRSAQPFISDLSIQDFVLLRRAGWRPLRLVCGASFVFVPRRNPVQVAGQWAANVELENYTKALYQARTAAMERMQAQAIHVRGAGVVGVQLWEGTLEFARHAMQFAAMGTAIAPSTPAGGSIVPAMALALDDRDQRLPRVL